MNNLFKKSAHKGILLFITLMLGIVALFPNAAQAATSYSPPETLYQSTKDNGHAISSGNVSSFGYGTKIGRVNLANVQAEWSSINGFTAYLSDSPITIGYTYNGNAYQGGQKDKWHLESDSGTTIAGTELSGKIKMGTLIVQMSSSGKNWGEPVFEVDDLFTDKKLDRSSLYTISTEDIKQGKYIRITVAYEMEKQVGKKSGLFGGAIYDYLYCTEVYQFYAGFNGDPVQLRDIMTGKVLHTDQTVPSGFVIDKNGSSNTIRIKKDNGDWTAGRSLSSITEPGSYTVEVTTPLKKTYFYTIKVTDGIKTAAVKPLVYENSKKDKYTLDNRKYSRASFGLSSLSSLTVAQSGGKAITVGKYSGWDAYGVTGSSVYLLLNLNNAKNLNGDWQIVADTWGKKDKELIEGVHTGPVDTGALIIQTSSDGKNWRTGNNDKGQYANGLYTTDFVTHYGGRGDICIYLPYGAAVNKGLYVRVLYAYEIENKAAKADYRCIEKYEFYLCSDNLDAVTFHNLSLSETLKESFGELDENEAAVYRMAETMQDGAYTATGFIIDKSGNPTATYKVKRNGEAYTAREKYTETGRYEIEITSKVGSTRTVTLFVDRMNKEEALSVYFGDPPFISGKRIYSEGSYPRYEGGQTQYSLAAVDNNHLPLSGYILSPTGEKTEIPATREAKTGVLTEAGKYVAVFATREEGFESGDRKIFTFRFELIAEGTAPGPVINQQKLREYAGSTASDSYPLFYALRFSGYPKGTITLAFQNEEDAYNYAYKYESGMVEKWDSVEEFVYSESYIIKEKNEYDGWDLADALNDSARNAIQSGCFDFTKPYKVTTIDPEYIEEHLFTDDIANDIEYEREVITDLRKLYLERSITLFAPGQKEKLTSMNEAPFLISDKPYYYLDPVEGGTVSSGFTHFEFFHDEHGYDSETVTIADRNGKVYEIRYGESVGKQLADAGCPSGVITITEQTVYGDATSYDAIYIAEGENTAVASISGYQKGEAKSFTLTQNDDGAHLEVDTIKSLRVSDALDPYDLVIVEKDKAESAYVLDQFDDRVVEEVGTYTVKIINRLGAVFSFTVDVIDPDFAAIGFDGEGTEALSDVPTQYGAQHVSLPALQREGYNLVGFEDPSGTIHSGEMEEITFRGEQILHAVWEAKQFKADFINPDGSTSTIDVAYDSQITLPTPEVPEGKKFDGWIMDGQILENNLFTLKAENDITFTASVSDESVVMRAVHSLMNYAAEHMVVVIAGAAGVLVLIILIGWGSARAKRRRRP